MFRSIKHELKPNDEQKRKLDQIFGGCRFIYNWGLDKCIKSYEEKGSIPTTYDLQKECTILRRNPEYSWLKEIGVASLSGSLANLGTAYKNFFRHKQSFPQFRKKHGRQSFVIRHNINVNYSKYTVRVPKVGYIKFYKDKNLDGEIRSITISKTPTGRYRASINYRIKDTLTYGKGAVGIDFGIKSLAVTSDNQIFENQKYLRSNLAKLRVEQRQLQRKFKKGVEEQSKNYYKQKLVVAKVYEKIKFQRKDYLHKFSTELARNYETVCIEDLNVAGMVRNHKLALSIMDCGRSMARAMLAYKVKDLRVIGRFEPSSQLCNICGDRKANLKLSERTWICANGHKLDRDLNAALNIRNIGLRAGAINAKVLQ